MRFSVLVISRTLRRLRRKPPNNQYTPSHGAGLSRNDSVTSVPLPLASVTRDLIQSQMGHGYTEQDFSTLLLLQAKASGIELEPENVPVDDGLN